MSVPPRALVCSTFAAGLAGALAESGRAAWAVMSAHGTVGDAASTALVVFGAIATPALLLGVTFTFLLSRTEVRAFALSLCSAIGGEETPRGRAIGAFVGALLMTIATLSAAWNGRRVGAEASANVAVSVTIATMLTCLVVAAPFAVVFARGIQRAGTGASFARLRTAPRWLVGPAVLVAGSIGVCAVLLALLPRPLLLPIGVSLSGFIICLAALQTPEVLAWANKRGTSILAVALAACIAAPFAIERTSPAARYAVFYRAPLASLIIQSTRKAIDRDGDGYSPVLLGGDCDDRKAAIHPGAIDIPENGVDENCSGADSHRYAPSTQAAFERPTGLAARPNIVFVMFDALRPDHLGMNGYPRGTSPNLDRFRESATLFTHAYTPAPATRFALSMLFTGRDMEDVTYRRGGGNDIDIADGVPTLASKLAALGYDRVGYTISFVIQHVHGVGQGFATWETPWPTLEWKENYPLMAKKTTDAAMATLAREPEDRAHPFFLFVHYACTHDPYAFDRRWNFGSRDIDHYDSAISHCDDEVGRLLAALDARGDANRTTVALFSDHGELFGEHGFWTHGHSIYEPESRIMLMMRTAGLRGVRTVDAPVLLSDLYATTLDLAGAPRDSRAHASFDLLPYIAGKAPAGAGARPLFIFTQGTSDGVNYDQRGILRGKFKLVRDHTTLTEQLFDVDADPEEATDIGPLLPEMRSAMAEEVDGWLRIGLHK
jgi:arylsulfatase A-like enzyme